MALIFFGARTKLLDSQILNEKCPNCQAKGAVRLNLNQRYAHIFWIPIFPFRKTGSTECNNCKQVLYQNEFPESIKHTVYKIEIDGDYGLLKIDKVEGESVDVLYSEHVYSGYSGIKELEKLGTSAYAKESVGLTKTKLKAMFDEGLVRDIKRR